MLALPLCAAEKLLVVSVDGLDQRYLEDRDKLGLKIPNLRRFLANSQWSQGVVGTMPTVTWPSHTTIIAGVPPSLHGILGNRRPASEGGDYYWSASLLRTPTLLDAMRQAGKTTGCITWPVTVDAPCSYNLPEYFRKRRGGSMDLPSIGSKAQPSDLVQRISAMFPSFAQEWMDDRTRTQAVIWMLKSVQPDLLLVHLVDHDSEAHDNAPFSREANAILEYTDELFGQMLAALPAGYAVALVSDHGFEQVQTQVNLKAVAGSKEVGPFRPMGGVVVADDDTATNWIRGLQADPQYGIGREIPHDELERFAPQLAAAKAAWEPAPGFWFGFGNDKPFTKPHEIGAHGHWPTRYRAVYAMRSSTVSAARLPEIAMEGITSRLAAVLGVTWPITSLPVKQ